ncbi:DUF3971 domain-containing protein [uncultured Shimia sp.]|uniref:YhdP family protein n=1 Tax=uncultured Shimia sp. TaxID=573152 RepID=UPI0026020148|nr:DUF3971 domain-containing protein [uncultured Shimia sp.]
MAQSELETTEAQPGRRSRRARRFGVIALFSLSVPVLVLAVAAFVISGKPLHAPEWLHTRVQAALNQQLDGLEVSIEHMALVVEDDWDPSIELQGVEVAPEDGGSPVRLETARARLAFAPLLDRQIALRDVQVSGVTLLVLRQEDGQVQVSIGQGGGAFQTDTDITTFGDQVEGYLQAPLLAYLDLFQIEDVTIRFEDRRAQRAWTVDGGHITLRRTDELVELASQMTLLGGRSYASTIEASVTTRFGSRTTEFGVNFEDLPSDDIASQSAALSWLQILRAPISGALRASIDSEGNLGNVNATLQIADGVLQPDGAVRPVPFESMRSYLTYDPNRGAIRFDELSLSSDMVRVNAHGEAFFGSLSQGLPEDFLVQLTLNEFRANPRNLDDDPVALERSFADFRLKLDPFELDLGQLVVRQNGNQIVLDGSLTTEGENWAYALNGHMDEVVPESVLALWPKSFKHKLRKWIDQNIYKATLHDIDLAVRSRGAEPPEVYVDFQFRDVDIKPVKTMPPVRDGIGFGVLQNHQLHITAEAGYVEADQGGRMDVAGTNMVILNTRIKQSPAVVQAQARGPVEAVLSLLDRKPLELFTKANLPVDFASGWADLEGTVELVLKDKLPIEEVVYDVRGDLSDVRSGHFLPGKEMRGDLQVTATPERVEVWGDGFVANIPVSAKWHMQGGKENAGRSWVSGTAELSAAALDTFEVGLPKGTVSEVGQARYEMDIVRDQPPKMRLRSDLVGVRMSSPPLGWSKSAKSSGTLEVDLTLGKSPSIDRILFEAPGLSARGRISIADGGGLGVAQMDSFVVGRWLNGTGRLLGRGKAPPAVVMTSGRLDMRRMPDSSKGSGRGGAAGIGPVTANVDEVVVTDNIRLGPMKAELNFDGGLSGSFNGNFKGGPLVFGTLAPHRNGTQLRVTSDHGGKIAQLMGVVKSASRGAMTLSMVPRAAKGEYDGVLEMKEVKVQQMPLVAELLNAISVVGLVEQLAGPGILFTDVFARFRLTPDRLVIGESSAAGPSMGLSANGTYSFAQEWFNIQGTISPIYAVNVIGRPFARRGEGLIGFNYTMRGPAQQPEISVNPLSALTPGFFREIFRRPPPDLSN